MQSQVSGCQSQPFWCSPRLSVAVTSLVLQSQVACCPLSPCVMQSPASWCSPRLFVAVISLAAQPQVSCCTLSPCGMQSQASYLAAVRRPHSGSIACPASLTEQGICKRLQRRRPRFSSFSSAFCKAWEVSSPLFPWQCSCSAFCKSLEMSSPGFQAVLLVCLLPQLGRCPAPAPIQRSSAGVPGSNNNAQAGRPPRAGRAPLLQVLKR